MIEYINCPICHRYVEVEETGTFEISKFRLKKHSFTVSLTSNKSAGINCPLSLTEVTIHNAS